MPHDPSAEPDLLGLLWRHKVGLVLALAIGGGLGYWLSTQQPVRYTAEARVFLSASSDFDPLDRRSTSSGGDRFVVQQALLMASRPVLARVDAGSAADLARRVEATPSGDSDLITVRATGPDPAEAALLADGVATAYQGFVAETVEAAAERAAAAVPDAAQAAGIRAAAAVYDDGVAVVESAEVPSRPSQPVPLRDALFGAVLAVLLYLLGAVLAQSRGRRRRAARAAADERAADQRAADERAADQRAATEAGPAPPAAPAGTVTGGGGARRIAPPYPEAGAAGSGPLAPAGASPSGPPRS